MNSYPRAAVLAAVSLLLAACGQKGPLYVEREEPPQVSTDPKAPPKRIRTTVEPASKDNTSTELPPVIE